MLFRSYTEGNSQTFKAKGDYTLETENVFASEVWTDVQSGGVYAEGTADSATFEELMSSHGVNPVDMPDYFVDALE